MKKKISRKRTKRVRYNRQKARTTRHKRLTRQKVRHSKKRTNMKRKHGKRSYKKYNRERIIQEGGTCCFPWRRRASVHSNYGEESESESESEPEPQQQQQLPAFWSHWQRRAAGPESVIMAQPASDIPVARPLSPEDTRERQTVGNLHHAEQVLPYAGTPIPSVNKDDIDLLKSFGCDKNVPEDDIPKTAEKIRLLQVRGIIVKGSDGLLKVNLENLPPKPDVPSGALFSDMEAEDKWNEYIDLLKKIWFLLLSLSLYSESIAHRKYLRRIREDLDTRIEGMKAERKFEIDFVSGPGYSGFRRLGP